MTGIKLNSIYVFSFDNIKKEENYYPGALISIMNPNDVKAFKTSKYDYVLELDFEDITFKDIQSFNAGELLDNPHIFNETMAKSIWTFVDVIKYKAENLTIHCNKGLSRSPAIAESIYDVLKPHVTCYKCKAYAPNKYVIEVMKQAYSR